MLQRRVSAAVELQDLPPLDTAAKQAVYAVAHVPVQTLLRELKDARERLSTTQQRDSRLGPGAVSPEYRAARAQCDDLERRLRAARRNAAADVFAQLNRDELRMGRHAIDFHGLHAFEARAKFDELIVPTMSARDGVGAPVLAEMVIITGRGAHSSGGVGVLREVVERHAALHGLACESVEGNAGALRISHPPS